MAPSYLESVGLKPKENYDILKAGEEVDSYEAWNNDVARGVRPILIERSASTGSTETSGRMGRLRDQRQRMESVRAKTEREENADSNSINNELAQESRSDNQGGFSNAQNLVDVLSQSAWHGSGAIFDHFDLGYVGTGEGAQVH